MSVDALAATPAEAEAALAGLTELELLGPASYPYVLVLMAASALVPMWYFRKRGWLR